MGAIEDLLELEAVKNVRIQYCHYFDGQEIEKLADLFTEDAVCEFGPDYGGDWVGRAVIRENFQKYADAEGPPFSVLHAVTNPLVQLTGSDTARGRWYLLDLNVTPGQDNPLILFGVYDDLYRKVAGSWKIERTRIDFLWPKRQIMEPRS